MGLKQILEHLKDGIKSELKKAKKLEGEKLQSFVNIFKVSEDAKIYYNKYNLIITEQETLEEIQPFLKQENLIISLAIKSFNSYLWVYDITNDALFDQLLNEFELEE